jgi:uncharacterized protein (DUF924 family)
VSEFDAVLAYWFLPEPTTEAAVDERVRFWFRGGAAVDREIAERFDVLVQSARRGELAAWTETPRGTLALIVLLDQFPRNVYRHQPAAFASDAQALGLARTGFDDGRFDALGTAERIFANLPFQHAEDLADQQRGVALAVKTALGAQPPWRNLAVQSVDAARKHLDVIARFGRFPHRNAVLGRASLPAELEYLQYLELAKQWL